MLNFSFLILFVFSGVVLNNNITTNIKCGESFDIYLDTYKILQISSGTYFGAKSQINGYSFEDISFISYSSCTNTTITIYDTNLTNCDAKYYDIIYSINDSNNDCNKNMDLFNLLISLSVAFTVCFLMFVIISPFIFVRYCPKTVKKN